MVMKGNSMLKDSDRLTNSCSKQRIMNLPLSRLVTIIVIVNQDVIMSLVTYHKMFNQKEVKVLFQSIINSRMFQEYKMDLDLPK